MTGTVLFAVPGDLDAATGGYAYDRRMIAELRELGWTVGLLPLSARFPSPGPEDLAAADAALRSVDAGAAVLIDGLAFGAMPEVARRHAGRLRLVALVHHPLALESGLSPEAAFTRAASERAALASAAHVVATSAFTARQLQRDYGVDPDRLSVVRPGTDPGPPRRAAGDPPLILSVGALVPRKGHDLLVAALAGLTDLAWCCRIVGPLDRDPSAAALIGQAIDAAGLGRRIALVGQVADVRAEMAHADLFVLPSRHEGYGMALAEAISQGLPIVACAAGAVPDLVPPDAGVLVPVDDVVALGAALRSLLSEPARRAAFAAGALRAAGALPNWAGSARDLARALSDTAP